MDVTGSVHLFDGEVAMLTYMRMGNEYTAKASDGAINSHRHHSTTTCRRSSWPLLI